MNFEINSRYIRGQIICLQERKAYNENIGCSRVANRLQREIDQLEKQLAETEREVCIE